MFVQKHKRFYDIRNDYVNEVEQIAQHRYAQQQQQQQQQRRTFHIESNQSVCLSLYLSVCVRYSLAIYHSKPTIVCPKAIVKLKATNFFRSTPPSTKRFSD